MFNTRLFLWLKTWWAEQQSELETHLLLISVIHIFCHDPGCCGVSFLCCVCVCSYDDGSGRLHPVQQDGDQSKDQHQRTVQLACDLLQEVQTVREHKPDPDPQPGVWAVSWVQHTQDIFQLSIIFRSTLNEQFYHKNIPDVLPAVLPAFSSWNCFFYSVSLFSSDLTVWSSLWNMRLCCRSNCPCLWLVKCSKPRPFYVHTLRSWWRKPELI